MELENQIKLLAKAHFQQFVEVRRYLHAHPELSFQEQNTSNYIRQQLKKIGINDVKPVAQTGLLASVTGKCEGKAVLLRADIDALPINEKNQVSYS